MANPLGIVMGRTHAGCGGQFRVHCHAVPPAFARLICQKCDALYHLDLPTQEDTSPVDPAEHGFRLLEGDTRG